MLFGVAGLPVEIVEIHRVSVKRDLLFFTFGGASRRTAISPPLVNKYTGLSVVTECPVTAGELPCFSGNVVVSQLLQV